MNVTPILILINQISLTDEIFSSYTTARTIKVKYTDVKSNIFNRVIVFFFILKKSGESQFTLLGVENYRSYFPRFFPVPCRTSRSPRARIPYNLHR